MTVASLLGGHRARLVVAIALALGGGTLALVTPIAVAAATDAALDRDRDGVIAAAALLAAVAVLAGVAGAAAVRVGARVAEDVLHTLRTAGAERLAVLSVADVEGDRRGDLMQRVSEDVAVLAVAARDAIPAIVRAFALMVLGLVGVLVLHPLLALAVLSTLPVVAVVVRRFVRRSTPIYAREREATAIATTLLVETAEAAPTLRRFGAQDARRGQVEAAAEDLAETQREAMRARNRLYPVLEAAEGASLLAVLLVGALLVDAGTVEIGAVVGATLAAATLLGPVEELVDWFDELLLARPAFTRVGELLDRPAHPPAPARAVPLPARGALRLEGVHVAYPGADVLRGVDLVVPAGRSVALLGPTGAGKSTLGRIASRLEDPDAGTVRLGDVDLRDASPDDLRARIVHVPQDGALVGPTLADDVRLGRPDATDDEVAAALDAVGASAWWRALPDGLGTATPAGFSSGERQLVALARVALADPAVIVLDEATSALDDALDLRVEEALARLFADRAVLVIAHRPATAAAADERVVIRDGVLAPVD